MAGLPLLLSLTALAQDLVVLSPEPPPAPDTVACRWVDELRLSGIEVAIEVAPEGFDGASLADRLATVESRLERGPPVAWLSSAPVGHTVAVAFVGEGRAVVRVASATGPTAWMELAGATRAILEAAAEPGPPEPVPVAPPARGGLWVHGALGVTVPTVGEALGPRILGEVALWAGRPGAVRWGGGLGLGAGRQQLRGAARVGAWWGPLRVGAAVDLARLPWVLWAQPRLEVGVAPRLPGGVVPELRLRVSPVRDRVEEGASQLYDTGWVEIGLHLGGVRQIRGPSRQGGM